MGQENYTLAGVVANTFTGHLYTPAVFHCDRV